MKRKLRKTLNTRIMPISRVLNIITLLLGLGSVACICCIESCNSGKELYYGIMSLVFIILTIIFNSIAASFTRFLYFHGWLKKRYIVKYFYEFQ